MQNLDLLKCFMCSNSLVEFVVLACNHAICGECFASATESQLQWITIQCPCGITTNISKQKGKERESMFLKPCSTMPNIKKNKAEILDQSSFTVLETRHSGSLTKISKISSQNLKKDQGFSNLSNYLLTQLSNEIKFMELRFKRYLNEINRCFNKLVLDLNKNYEQVLESVITKCQFKIETNQFNCISSIQSCIEKAFKPGLERKLTQISKTLSKFICLRVQKGIQNDQKQNCFRQNSSRKSSSKNKRHSTHEFCKVETGNSLFQLKSLVKGSKIKKKQTRKPQRTKIQLN